MASFVKGTSRDGLPPPEIYGSPFRCNATGQHREASPNEFCPGGRALELRRHITVTQNLPICYRQIKGPKRNSLTHEFALLIKK